MRSSWQRVPTGSKARQPPRRPVTPDASVPEESLADEAEERGPLRRCIVTRERGERARMIRFVLAPDRTVVPDLAAKLPGRGMWLSARADVLERAVKRGAFARVARGPVLLPPDLASMISAGLTRRVIDLLGLARRAGQAVGGFAKAREALVQARVGVVVQASDGSDDECRRLLSGADGIPVVRPLAGSRLGAVFGRDHLVHVAVAPGRLAEALVVETGRLAGMAGRNGMMNGSAPERRAPSERTGE